MPKRIEGLREQLMGEARMQALASGYQALTIRSVAAACGVGVGTVYNYFPSKDALLASFMLEDWKTCLEAIEQTANRTGEPLPVLACIHRQLTEFADRYQAIFRDEAAAPGFARAMSRYHSLLRGQLAAPLRPFCPDDLTAAFVAESMLTWTMDGVPFEQLEPIMMKLF